MLFKGRCFNYLLKGLYKIKPQTKQKLRQQEPKAPDAGLW